MNLFTLNFAGKLGFPRLAAALARKVCSSLRDKTVDEDFVNAVELAVSETCTNAVKHGPASANRITIVFQVLADRLTINVKSEGKGFDPEKAPPLDFEEHPESGYGIYIIKSKMDEVKFFKENRWNVLSMSKYFKSKRTVPS